jgi:NIMA (never in mitosis gene a)-related kinase
MSINLNDFEKISKIGEGTNSSVYRIKSKENNHIYALKQIKINNINRKYINNSLKELRILSSVNNSNVIAYYEIFLDERTKTLCIIMEYADSGDL